MKENFLTFNGVSPRDPAIAAWMKRHPTALGALAKKWFTVIRNSGDEVLELFHDGCPVACFGNAPFAYVNIFSSHVNVGFFHGASLPDPAHLLQGTGKFMRHVKLHADAATNPNPATTAALTHLIQAAHSDIKSRVEFA